MYMNTPVDYLILISDYADYLVKKIEEKGGKSRQVKLDKFSKFIDKLLKKTLEEITAELNLSDEREPLIIPALVLYKMMAQNVNPKEVWVPGANIQDGMAFDYAQHNKLLASTHDFDADVISAYIFIGALPQFFSTHSDTFQAIH